MQPVRPCPTSCGGQGEAPSRRDDWPQCQTTITPPSMPGIAGVYRARTRAYAFWATGVPKIGVWPKAVRYPVGGTWAAYAPPLQKHTHKHKTPQSPDNQTKCKCTWRALQNFWSEVYEKPNRSKRQTVGQDGLPLADGGCCCELPWQLTVLKRYRRAGVVPLVPPTCTPTSPQAVSRMPCAVLPHPLPQNHLTYLSGLPLQPLQAHSNSTGLLMVRIISFIFHGFQTPLKAFDAVHTRPSPSASRTGPVAPPTTNPPNL